MIRSEHMKSCLAAQKRFLSGRGPAEASPRLLWLAGTRC